MGAGDLERLDLEDGGLMGAPFGYAKWFRNLQIPWLVANPVGGDYWDAIGDVLDGQVERHKQATKARFPELAPSDALGFIAADRLVDRGPAETDPGFATRLRKFWEHAEYFGTPPGMLVALYYGGFDGAVIVTQLGNGYYLNGAPNLDDPAANVVSVDLGTNPTLPGSPPWWQIDLRWDFTSRFEILFPGPRLPSIMRTMATATFTGVESSVAAMWNNPFEDVTYHAIAAAPVVSSGGPVIVSLDAATKTPTGINVITSAPFVGSVDLLGWRDGQNPFGDIRPNDLARLHSIIRKWRPAKATCTGVYVLVQGQFIGWPVRTIGSSPTIGPAETVVYPGA